jgi:hypothetical protein
MAQVPIITKWIDAKRYLEGLRGSIKADVAPLLSTAGGAPFAICREVLCYIDHLGHLFKGNVGVGERFKKYMDHIMANIDSNYSVRANEIYQMYRCGSVHEFEPKVLINNNNERLAWLCYLGKRSGLCEINSQQVAVEHLKILLPSGSSVYYLPVSTYCLVNDLIESIGLFINSKAENDRVLSWNEAATVLSPPQKYNFVI